MLKFVIDSVVSTGHASVKMDGSIIRGASGVWCSGAWSNVYLCGDQNQRYALLDARSGSFLREMRRDGCCR